MGLVTFVTLADVVDGMYDPDFSTSLNAKIQAGVRSQQVPLVRHPKPSSKLSIFATTSDCSSGMGQMHREIVEPGSTDQFLDIGNDTLLAADDARDFPQLHEGFRVTDASTASWVVRRINEARTHAKRVQEWADREIHRAKRDDAFLLLRFGEQLQKFAAQEVAKLKGRRRSVCLPGGTLGFRAHPAKLVVKDESVALAWCRRHLPEAFGVRVSAAGPVGLALLNVSRGNPDECRVEEGLQVSVLVRHLGETGECIPGTDVAPPGDKFYGR